MQVRVSWFSSLVKGCQALSHSRAMVQQPPPHGISKVAGKYRIWGSGCGVLELG
jgi:hypothetical protein